MDDIVGKDDILSDYNVQNFSVNFILRKKAKKVKAVLRFFCISSVVTV